MQENRWTGTGRLGKNPASGESGSNKTLWAKFSIACDNGYYDRDKGQYVTTNPDGSKIEPDWIPCVAFGYQAQKIIKELQKGDAVFIVGELKNQPRTDDRFRNDKGEACVRYESVVKVLGFERLVREKSAGFGGPSDADVDRMTSGPQSYPAGYGPQDSVHGGKFDDFEPDGVSPPLNADGSPLSSPGD